MKYQKIKGTNDFFNEEAIKYRYIEQVATEESKKFGFSEVITPIFEITEIFTRRLKIVILLTKKCILTDR